MAWIGAGDSKKVYLESPDRRVIIMIKKKVKLTCGAASTCTVHATALKYIKFNIPGKFSCAAVPSRALFLDELGLGAA